MKVTSTENGPSSFFSPVPTTFIKGFGAWCVLSMVLMLASSCATYAPEQRSQAPPELPQTFTLYENTAPSPERWWESFGSAELNGLVEEALKDNLTLKQAYSRLDQSRALVTKAGSDRWPDLELTSEISNTLRRTDTGTGSASTSTVRKRSLGLASSYELDLWGEVKSEYLSARFDMEVTREELNTAALTLASEVTLKWLEAISVRQQLELIDNQLETNLITLELIELRFRKGAATVLDVFQQRQAVKETESSIPLLEAQLQTLKHEIAVLLGKPPRTRLSLGSAHLPTVGSIPDAGVPADLLSRRPDVRAAGLKLKSADWMVSAARADRLPAVRLTGSVGYSAGEWSGLFDNWVRVLAASITAPLFDGGNRRAEVKRQTQVVEERLAAYRLAVFTAIMEVEDALVNERKQGEYIAALSDRLNIVRSTLTEALQRYRKGLNDYLPVLSALTSTQRLERTLVQARLQRLNYRVMLHRALGGSWMQDELQNQESN